MRTVSSHAFPAAKLTVGCKLNLHLNITGVRDNGYHNLETLFYYLPKPSDTIVIKPGEPGKGLRLFCPGFLELETKDNILARTYELFSAQCGKRHDINVTLYKNIPMGAGLGGGSADAAALLTWLNQYGGDENSLNAEALMSSAARLGADVPFFMYVDKNKGAKAAWGQGIGEKLTLMEIPEISGLYLLLVFPPVGVSTPWAYRAWDNLALKQRSSDAFFALEHLTSAEPEDKYPHAQALRLYNSFEAVVFPEYAELRHIKECLFRGGAAAALMSGSGSTIFGLFRNQDKALESVAGFQRENCNCILQQL